MAVQGFGRPVAPEGAQYKRIFLSGSSAKSFTPDTADMSLNVENGQDVKINEMHHLGYKITSILLHPSPFLIKVKTGDQLGKVLEEQSSFSARSLSWRKRCLSNQVFIDKNCGLCIMHNLKRLLII